MFEALAIGHNQIGFGNGICVANWGQADATWIDSRLHHKPRTAIADHRPALFNLHHSRIEFRA